MSEKKQKYNPEVTKEDIDILGKRNLSMNNKEDLPLKNREKPVDFTGKGLDVPGRVTPKNRNKENLKDEENTLYAQGGGRNSELEQRKDSDKPIKNNKNG